jgi:SOS-response transcriptional repressor LexA
MTLKDRIAAAMKHAKMNQTTLAVKTGTSKGAVSLWLNGSTKRLKGETAWAIAKETRVSHEWLATGVGDMLPAVNQGGTNYRHAPQNLPSVPVISSIRAGNWGDINDHEPDTDMRVEARYTNPSRYAFALIVEGDSMTCDGVNSFPAGTALIVEPERSPKAGDFVIAKDTAAGAGTFKQLTSDGTRWYLKPLNRAYPTLPLDDMAKRVIGVIIEFQPPGGKL